MQIVKDNSDTLKELNCNLSLLKKEKVHSKNLKIKRIIITIYLPTVIDEIINQICTLFQASLEERLAFSESLSKKNNEAVHSTSEQLLKANQIISKQNTDLIEMKEKVIPDLMNSKLFIANIHNNYK